MKTLEEQIHAYTAQIEEGQRPVAVDEAFALVDTVRAFDSGTRVSPAPRPWQGLLVATAVAATVVLLIGSAFLIRTSVNEQAQDAGTTTESTNAPGAVASETVQMTETHLGTWVWEKSEVPIGRPVAEYDGLFYATQSDPILPSENRNPDNWLLTSSDGVSWERTLLPEDMNGDAVSVSARDDGLIILGLSTAKLSPTCWQSTDATTWTPTDCPSMRSRDLYLAPAQNDLYLALPDITTEGVEPRIQTFADPVLAGGTRLVQANLYFEFPDFVNEILGEGYSYSGQGGTDTGTFEVFGEDDSVVSEIDYVIDGSSIEYTFWSGSSDDGEIFHTARIDMGSTALMNQIDPGGGLLAPSLNLLWRSGRDGGPFEVVDDPLVSTDRGTLDHQAGITRITSIDDAFVAYGAVVGGPTTRVNEFNEPSYIGAIATSSDGLTWTMTEVPDFVNPFGLNTQMSDGRTVWDGQYGVWVSADGLSGTVFPHPAGEPVSLLAANDLIVMRGSDTQIQISSDGREWSGVPLPQRRGDLGFSGFDFTSGTVFYTVIPRGLESTTWVGGLDE